ncbi:MAG: hypothetical protein SV966_12505 [Actinomycetota bacterium]|nr:hypothetical protein [Actinomycetota bacterium]
MNAMLPVPSSDPVSGEVVVVLDRPAAEKLDGRIRRLVGQVDGQLGQVSRLLDDARRGQIHQTLGFTSWPAYVADVLGGTLQLSGDARQAMVELMSSEGMSLRAIATATGVSKDTVSRDLAQVSHDETPAALPHPSATPATVTGLDGKAHPRHRPAPTPTTTRRRAPFPGQFSGGVAGLERIVNNLEKLTGDDRFRDFARSDAGAVSQGSLRRYIAALQAVADQFPEPSAAVPPGDTPMRGGEVHGPITPNRSGLSPVATWASTESCWQTTP